MYKEVYHVAIVWEKFGMKWSKCYFWFTKVCNICIRFGLKLHGVNVDSYNVDEGALVN